VKRLTVTHITSQSALPPYVSNENVAVRWREPGRPGSPRRTFYVQNRRKTLAMPGHDRFGLDDDQRGAPVAPRRRTAKNVDMVAGLDFRVAGRDGSGRANAGL